jgi:hypothetical protein
VTGIDTSVELLEIAHTVSPTARFVNASIYETQIPACEAVVAIGEPLAYHDDPDADHLVGQFFRRGREVHKVRLFDTPAVCAELASCGFTTRTAGGLLGE